MSITQPLEVRLRTARADRYVTAELRGLRWRTASPGGFAWARLTLDRPLTIQPDEIAPYGQLFVYDARDARTVFEGRLEDPARGAGRDGQVWELAAVGPAAHCHDRNVPLIYVDTSYDRLMPSPGKAKFVQIGADARSSDGEFTYAIKIDAGSTVGNVDVGGVMYPTIWEAGQKLARFALEYSMGATTTDFAFVGSARNSPTGASDVPLSVTWTTTPTAVSRVVVTDWTNGRAVLVLRIGRSAGGPAVVGETGWVGINNLAIRAMLFNADGTEKTTGYTTDTILASDVVRDLLGRLLPKFDGAGASIATTTHPIEQLAYPDGVDPMEVLEDLQLLEPAFTWEAYESNPATGKHRFAWRSWPTTVRYDADVDDGYESTGSAVELYNAVAVRWTDPGGRVRSTRRTQVVPDLDAAGLTREPKPIDLGDELGSLANAQRVGDQFLAEHKFPPNAGKLTIARPVYDHLTGGTVMPWEILPGYLIRVGGILPRVDALNPSGRDGSTIFKVAAMEYDAGDAGAELELDSYPPTVTRALAELARRSRTTGGPQRRR